MSKNYLAVRVGNGNKEHLGLELTRNEKVIGVVVSCGSRRMGTSKKVIGQADLVTYAQNPNRCEKCERKAA